MTFQNQERPVPPMMCLLLFSIQLLLLQQKSTTTVLAFTTHNILSSPSSYVSKGNNSPRHPSFSGTITKNTLFFHPTKLHYLQTHPSSSLQSNQRSRGFNGLTAQRYKSNRQISDLSNSRSLFWRLNSKISDNDDNEDNNKDQELTVSESQESSVSSSSESNWFNFLKWFQGVLEAIKSFPLVMWFYKNIFQRIYQAKVVMISFSLGILLTWSAIFIPYYASTSTSSSSSSDTLSAATRMERSVTLFETVLQDLSKKYVEDVDDQKLFETGMNAMLQSLDPYTEFEGKKEAEALNESMGGKYGGIGLVISGASPRDLELYQKNNDGPPKVESTKQESEDKVPATINDKTGFNGNSINDDDEDDEENRQLQMAEATMERIRQQGIRVVSAFEGYAYDYGMRVGDQIVGVNDKPISSEASVEDVRNQLRGVPGTAVKISFRRVGVDGIQSVTIPRTVVKIRDVKCVTLLGRPTEGIGYIQLTGFASDAGREVRNAIQYLNYLAQEATLAAANSNRQYNLADELNEEMALKGLILDLRGNPGGLLTSAVDVSSLLVPRGSEIVSAKGRGFPGVTYKSRVNPVINPQTTKLAVLINGGTASAAEIVSGAVQDLDVGIIVGSDRSFGKGLVQNVEELPFDTALKFTVAKYYTPSGRCIQGINYREGGGLKVEDSRYKAQKVADKDKSTFYTRLGRQVKDGGGIEADYKVAAPQASALEVTLLRSGVIGDFAAQWCEHNQLQFDSNNKFIVDETMYREFQEFVAQKQMEGEIKLDALYNGPLTSLQASLKRSGYKGSTKELENLRANIVREVTKDFEKYRNDIKEDIAQGILARYLPESMLVERSLATDKQVEAAVKLLRNGKQFDSLLAKGSLNEKRMDAASTMMEAAAATEARSAENGAKINLKW